MNVMFSKLLKLAEVVLVAEMQMMMEYVMIRIVNPITPVCQQQRVLLVMTLTPALPMT